MSRTFDPPTLVTLPKMSAPESIALATATTTRARQAGPLPDNIDKSVTRVEGALQDTQDAVSAHIDDMGTEGTASRKSERALTAAWASGRDWTNAWVRLPNQPAVNEPARRVHAALFADGLRFTQRTYNVQWVESQARLDIIVEQGLEPIFINLGGQLILDTIREAHATYGRAIGLTAPLDDSPQTQGQAARVLLDEMRRFVVRVVAHVDPDEPATQALAEYLLFPITNWRPTPSSKPESVEDSGDLDRPSESDNDPTAPEPTDPSMLNADLPRSSASGEITLQ